MFLFLSDGAAGNTTPTDYAQPNRSNKQRSPDIPSPSVKPKTPETPTQNSNANFSNIQNQLKKQLALDSRSRGPPPPAPVRTVSWISMGRSATVYANMGKS